MEDLDRTQRWRTPGAVEGEPSPASRPGRNQGIGRSSKSYGAAGEIRLNRPKHFPKSGRIEAMTTAVLTLEQSERRSREARGSTLLDLVAALAESGASEVEVVRAITHLVNSRRVRLVGQFREAHIQIH